MRYCSECKKEKKGFWCDFCKNNTGNNFVLKIEPSIVKIRLHLIRMTHKRLGVKKFLFRVFVGWQETKGLDSVKYPEGVYIHRTVDREHDKYKEIIISAETGEITRNVSELLSQHIPNKQKRNSDN